MIYEDIEEVRAKQVALEAGKDKAKEGVSRKGKRKSSAMRTTKQKRTRKSELDAAEAEITGRGMESYCSILQF